MGNGVDEVPRLFEDQSDEIDPSVKDHGNETHHEVSNDTATTDGIVDLGFDNAFSIGVTVRPKQSVECGETSTEAVDECDLETVRPEKLTEGWCGAHVACEGCNVGRVVDAVLNPRVLFDE